MEKAAIKNVMAAFLLVETDLFLFLYPKDAPQEGREEGGGSHEHNFHINTPYVKN